MRFHVFCPSILAGALASGCAEPPGEPAGSEHEHHASSREAASDLALPARAPAKATGEDGFSRVVYREVDGRVVPSLIEGPQDQVRCQEEALPCSYLDLKALYESSAEIPGELQMNREELGKLVSELDSLSATLARYRSIDEACAAGFRARSKQKKNMGIHMIQPRAITEAFDPADPEILLFAKPDGQRKSREELGQCDGDRWAGDADYQIVGAAFMVAATGQHPEGFTGPLDNWHAHFNSCVDGDNEPMPAHHGSKAGCEAAGGIYMDPSPWMLHVYAVPTFDSQSGVFAMHNESIWPQVSPQSLSGEGHSGHH